MNKRKIGFILLSVLLGVLVGAIALAIGGFNPIKAYSIMIKGVISKPRYIAWTIIRATPIIFTGLSVTFAFRTGLFNIGAEGQYIVGALTAALVGYFVQGLPSVLHISLIIVAAALAAGLWGGLAGLLKAKYGVNEVISTIMLNWIALYLNNYIVFWDKFRRPNSEASYRIQDSANLKILPNLKNTEAGKEFLANNKMIKEVLGTPLNYGIILAVVFAVLIWYILKKTTLGYELRTVGLNKYAAEYGGINVNKSIVISMVISGVLAGLGGATQVLGVTREVSVLAAMEGNGFDGIAVALLGSSTAIGSVLAGILFGALKYGGPKIQSVMNAPSEIINILIGSIVFFTSMPSLISILSSKIKTLNSKRRGELKDD